MSDEKDAPASDEQAVDNESGNETQSDGAAATPSKAASRWSVRLVFLLVVVLAVAGYHWYTSVYPAAEQAQAARIDQLINDDQQSAQAISELRQQIEDARAELQSLSADIGTAKRERGDLEAAVKTLYAKEAEVTLDWILSEVEYLVLAASQRLILEHDRDSAIAAMKAADKRLLKAAHPDLLPLREQIASDIAALDAVPATDIEGVAIYLAEASTRVRDLPTKPIADVNMSLSKMSQGDAQNQDWQGMAKSLWTDLKSLVDVKDGELSDSVLFDPELRYFLEQNLRLELASARLAVLRRDAQNFSAAITLVTDLLNRYYDTGSGEVGGLLKRLNELAALDLDPALPSLAPSLDAVRAKRADVRDAALAGSGS